LADTLTPLDRATVPDEVRLVKADLSPRFTPRELATIKARYGKSMTALMQDDVSDDRLIVVAWLRLRREGRDVDLDDMDDVVIGLPTELDASAVDPTNATPANGSPPSVSSGG
jgi:hypothetical protein